MPTSTRLQPLREVSRSVALDSPRSWLGILLVVQAGLIFNGHRFLGSQWPSDIALTYLIIGLIPLIMDDGLKRELLRGTVREYTVKLILGFMATTIVFWTILMGFLGLPVGRIAYSTVWPMIVLQAVFVAPVEELFFRGWLSRVVDPKDRTWRVVAGVTLGQLLAAALFSSYHYAAYGTESWTPYVITFGLAVVWTWTSRIVVGAPFHEDGRRPLGIPFTIGSHLAWNLCVLGVLTGGVLTGT